MTLERSNSWAPVVNTHPQLKEWGVGSPTKIDLDARIKDRGMYHATKRMKLPRPIR